MSNKKKRFQDSLECRLEILRLKKLAAADLRAAERMDKEIEELRLKIINAKEGDSTIGLAMQVNDFHRRGEIKRKHHSYLLERKIPMLVRVLAKLQTKPFVFMKGTSELEEAVK